MKKLLLVIAIVCSAMCIFTAGCGKKYTSDDNYHWPTNDASQKAPHEWNDGEIVTPATAETEGSVKYVCKVCNRIKIETLPVLVEHTYSKFWSYDQTKHWHDDMCKHENVTADEGAHDFEVIDVVKATAANDGEVTYRCKVCQYVTSAVLDYDSHEHMAFWEGDYKYHYQVYNCCDKVINVLDPAMHTFNDEYVCTTCGKYSLLAEITDDVINSGLFDYSVVLSDVHIAITSYYEPAFLNIEHLALNFGFDKDYNISARAEFTASFSNSSVETGEDEKEQIISDIEGVAVIKNDKIYLELDKEGKNFVINYREGNLIYNANDMAGSAYIIYDLEDFLYVAGLKDADQWFETYVFNPIYELSDLSKEITEDLINLFGDSIFDDESESANLIFTLVSTVLTPIEGENKTYTVDFSELLQINETLKDLTLGEFLDNLSEPDNYEKMLENKLKPILNTTVGDILDKIKASNIDIYEINALLNKYIAKYYPDNDINSLEDLISSQISAITFPEGVHVADYLNSDIIRAYKLIDIVNLLIHDGIGGNVTTDLFIEYISDYIYDNQDETLYEFVSDFINAKIRANEEYKLSNDIILMENMNTALSDKEAADGNFESVDDVIEFIADQGFDWHTEAAEYQIFWHEETRKFVLVNLNTKDLIYCGDVFDFTDDTVLYDSDGWDVTLKGSGIAKLNLTTDETVYTAVSEIAKALSQSLRISVKFSNDDGLSGVSIDVRFIADDKYADTSETEDYYSNMIKQFAPMVSKFLQEYYGTISIEKNYAFAFDEDEFIQTVKENSASLIPEDKDELKKIIDDSFDADEIINSTLTKDENGYVYEIEYTSDRTHYYISSDEDNDDYLVARYNVKKTFYISNDKIYTWVFDKCGSDFYEILYFTGTLEETPVSYFWESGTVLSDEEVIDIKRKAAEMYGEYSFLYEDYFKSYYSWFETHEVLMHYDSATEKFAYARFSDFDAEEYLNDGLHDYELISGSEQDVNSEYFIKLTYSCTHCGDIVYVYKRSQTTTD